ncbi:unnamed protein product [Sphagnum jensenii]|uniref:F-box domain-containing protein n=1 Tax=Sphagnum jensenii TaxID=128206 RepID=A0ABP0X9D7_9BRYO
MVTSSIDHNATMPTPSSRLQQQEGRMKLTRTHLDHSQDQICSADILDSSISSRSSYGMVNQQQFERPDASASCSRRDSTASPTAVLTQQQQQPLLPGLPDFLALECLARVSLATISSVSHAWRKLLSDLYFQRLRAQHGTVDLDWVYTLVKSPVDGCFRWYAFDPVAGRWHDLPPPPHAMDFQLTAPGCIGVSYSVQCTSTGTKLVMVAALKWRKPPLQQPLPRDDHDNRPAAAAKPGQVHDSSEEQDMDYSRSTTTTARARRSRMRPILEPALENPLVFDPITSSWTIGSPFRVARKWCACGVGAEDENLVYVVSGCGRDWDVNVAKSAEVYDVARDTWRRIAGPTSSKCSSEATAAVALGGNLHIVSGRGVFAKVGLVYTPATGKWTEMARHLREGITGECVSVDGKLFVLDEVNGRLRVYDPEEYEPEWRVFMEDARLQNLEQLVGRGSKLCGIVQPQSTVAAGQTSSSTLLNWVDSACSSMRPPTTTSHAAAAAAATTVADSSSLLRMIDVVTKPRRIVDLRVPFGHTVTVQLLSRMLVSHP